MPQGLSQDEATTQIPYQCSTQEYFEDKEATAESHLRLMLSTAVVKVPLYEHQLVNIIMQAISKEAARMMLPRAWGLNSSLVCSMDST